MTLGGTTLTAYLTPGHTKGCTSWGLDVREDGKTYHALIVCSFGVNDGYVLVGNKDYPQIASDYVATFAKARSLPVDVFLGSHGSFYGLNEKYAALKNRKPGEPNPFVDHAGYLAHIAAQEKRFQTMLDAQQSGCALALRPRAVSAAEHAALASTLPRKTRLCFALFFRNV